MVTAADNGDDDDATTSPRTARNDAPPRAAQELNLGARPVKGGRYASPRSHCAIRVFLSCNVTMRRTIFTCEVFLFLPSSEMEPHVALSMARVMGIVAVLATAEFRDVGAAVSVSFTFPLLIVVTLIFTPVPPKGSNMVEMGKVELPRGVAPQVTSIPVLACFEKFRGNN